MAAVKRLNRDWEFQRDDISRHWGLALIPTFDFSALNLNEADLEQSVAQQIDAITAPSLNPQAIPFAETYAGRSSRRDLDSAKRDSLTAADNGRDSLRLEAGVGTLGETVIFPKVSMN